MSSLLLNWVNNEVGLSRQVHSIDDDFRDGYLVGELLCRYNQQPDFGNFIDADTPTAKLNNFCLLEPTFRTLEVPFNSQKAFEVVNGKSGVMKSLLYELKMSLENLSRTAKPLSNNLPPINQRSQKIFRVVKPPKPHFDKTIMTAFENGMRQLIENPNDLMMERVLQKYRQKKDDYRQSLTLGASIANDSSMSMVLHKKDVAKTQLNIEREFKEAVDLLNTDQWKTHQKMRKERKAHEKWKRDTALSKDKKKTQDRLDNIRSKTLNSIDDFETALEKTVTTEDPEYQKKVGTMLMKSYTGDKDIGLPTLKYMNDQFLNESHEHKKKAMKEHHEDTIARQQSHAQRRQKFLRKKEGAATTYLQSFCDTDTVSQLYNTSHVEVEEARRIDFVWENMHIFAANREARDSLVVLGREEEEKKRESIRVEEKDREHEWILANATRSQEERAGILDTSIKSASRCESEEIATSVVEKVLHVVDWTISCRQFGMFDSFSEFPPPKHDMKEEVPTGGKLGSKGSSLKRIESSKSNKSSAKDAGIPQSMLSPTANELPGDMNGLLDRGISPVQVPPVPAEIWVDAKRMFSALYEVSEPFPLLQPTNVHESLPHSLSEKPLATDSQWLTSAPIQAWAAIPNHNEKAECIDLDADTNGVGASFGKLNEESQAPSDLGAIGAESVVTFDDGVAPNHETSAVVPTMYRCDNVVAGVMNVSTDATAKIMAEADCMDFVKKVTNASIEGFDVTLLTRPATASTEDDKKKKGKDKKDDKKKGKKDEEEENGPNPNKLSIPGWVKSTPFKNILGEVIVQVSCVADPFPNDPLPKINIPSFKYKVILLGTSDLARKSMAVALQNKLGNVKIINSDDLVAKAVAEAMTLHEKSDTSTDPASEELTPQQKVYMDVLQYVHTGKLIRDGLIVELIMYELASLDASEVDGFILQDFPNTKRQAVLLTEAISGIDYTANCPQPSDRISVLANPPGKLLSRYSPQKCGVDLALCVDLPTTGEVIRERLAARRDVKTESTVYLNETFESVEGLQELYTPSRPLNTSSVELSIAEAHARGVKDFFLDIDVFQELTIESVDAIESSVDDLAKGVASSVFKIIDPFDSTVTSAVPSAAVSPRDAKASIETALLGDPQMVIMEGSNEESVTEFEGSVLAPSTTETSSSAVLTASKEIEKAKTDKGEKTPKADKRKGSSMSAGRKSEASSRKPSTTSSSRKTSVVQPTEDEEAVEPVVDPDAEFLKLLPEKYVTLSRKLELPAGTPVPFELAKSLDKLWKCTESQLFSSGQSFFNGLRDLRYQTVQRRRIINDVLHTFFIRRDTRQDLFEDFRGKFNEIDDDFRFDQDCQAELFLRAYELGDAFFIICDKRRQEAEEYLTECENDATIAVAVHRAKCEAAAFAQSEYARFITAVSILMDMFKALTGYDFKASVGNSLEVTLPPPGVAEPDAAVDDNGESSKSPGGKSAKKDEKKDAKKDKGAFVPSREPIAGVVLGEDLMKTVPSAPQAVMGAESTVTGHSGATGASEKKGKKEKADKNAAPVSADPYEYVENAIADAVANWSRDTFTVNRGLYEDEEVAVVLESTIWHEAERLKFAMKELTKALQAHNRWLDDMEKQLFSYLRGLVVKRHTRECLVSQRVVEMILHLIEESEPMKQEWFLAPDAVSVMTERLIIPNPLPPPIPTVTDYPARKVNEPQTAALEAWIESASTGAVLLEQDVSALLDRAFAGVGPFGNVSMGEKATLVNAIFPKDWRQYPPSKLAARPQSQSLSPGRPSIVGGSRAGSRGSMSPASRGSIKGSKSTAVAASLLEESLENPSVESIANASKDAASIPVTVSRGDEVKVDGQSVTFEGVESSSEFPSVFSFNEFDKESARKIRQKLLAPRKIPGLDEHVGVVVASDLMAQFKSENILP